MSDFQSADAVVVFVGTDRNIADEGKDRLTIAMPGNYNSLIDQVAAVDNPRMALAIQSDGPVALGSEQAKFPAIVFSGFNGESQGTALADVLFGKQNPSGHLDFTWYADDSQLPAMDNYGLTPADTGGLGRTYQYFTGTPTFPFGCGLSYSDFSYSGVTADQSSVTADGTVNVTFTVTNTGGTAGATVAQLYAGAQFTVSGVTLPDKQLVGFQKTNVLNPGASQRITLPVKIGDLWSWDSTNMKEVVFDGTYALRVGASSSDVRGTANVAVTGSLTPKIQYVTVQPPSVVYNTGQSQDLTAKNPWIADDTTGVGTVPQGRNMSVTADNIVEAVNNDQSFVNLAGAQVSYATSDPTVATVSSSGLVHAVGDGVATISVTVNGVTGTAPIVVRHSVTLAAPALITAGGTVTATTRYVNGDTAAQSNVNLSVSAPSGWTATATTPASFTSVAAGQTVTTTWQVTAPSTASKGTYTLSAQASVSGTGPYADSSAINIAYPSFNAALDNVGVTDDSNTKPGSFSGPGGASYSAQTLATVGIKAGTAFHHDGATINLPNVASGTNDDIAADGQTVPLSGSGTTLAVLGASSSGTTSGSGTVIYTDGSTQPFGLGFADWWAKTPVSGTDIAATLPYINNGGGKQTQTVHLYYAAVPITAGKAVQAVVLPTVSTGTVPGQPTLHIFAMAVTTPSANTVISLRAHANGEFVTADNAGASSLIANHTSISQWQQFDLISNPDATVSLRSHANGEIVTAENTGTAPLIANRTRIGAFEKFDLVYNADGSVSMRSLANNKIVTAGASPLIADSTSIGSAQEFDLVYGNPISLRAHADNLFVTAEHAGASALIANRPAIGPWETFDLLYNTDGTVSLQAHANNAIVTADNAGAKPLIANRTVIGPWEKFDLINNTADGSISLRAHANNAIVTAANAGASPLIASSTSISPSEEFDLIND